MTVSSVYSDPASYLYKQEEPVVSVWRLSDMADFAILLRPALQYAAEQNRQVVYLQFASHTPLISGQTDNIATETLSLSHRFENFTVSVCEVIRRTAPGTLLVFDSLSELQTAWATDLMMKNFFLVVTPMIRERKLSAMFPLIRGRHSAQAISRIEEGADACIDIWSDFKNIYLRADKLYALTDSSLFQPMVFDAQEGTMHRITDGVMLSRFHRALDLNRSHGTEEMDSWDRFFDLVQRKYEYGDDVTEECSRMCRIMMTRDERMRSMIREHFTPEDYFFVKEHMIGSGLIGGKACGMLTARKIIENGRPDLYERLESHDSFYVGSDVYYTYIVENHFWDLRIRQRSEEEYFSLGDEFEDKLLHGEFPKEIREQFRDLLDYYGQSPVIVRSSSILEDGFDHAFAGKYESVFCPNTGTPEQRLEELLQAARIVYASTMNRSALDYRKRHGLSGRDEQMALLVQRVSGSHYGKYYMPCAAGVGYSYSPWRFSDALDPTAGMLRLVMGLGTSAVDRTEGSYPRIVSLDSPKTSMYKDAAERHRYSQQKIEMIDTEEGTLVRKKLSDVEPLLPFYLKQLLLEHDFDAERRFRERGQRRNITFISCKGLVAQEEIMQNCRDMMAEIQEVYQNPVDIEFTMNISESGDYVINLLQCRPLQVNHDRNVVSIPEELPAEQTLFDCRNASMGMSRSVKLDLLVQIDPAGYYNMPYNEKYRVSKVIGAINWHFRGADKQMLLLAPGRIGTSSPELGVPTAFADISEFNTICEVSESKVGYRPELSYGSHMFQDLVEADILYVAVFEDARTVQFRPELLHDLPNLLPEICPEDADLASIVHICDVSALSFRLFHDLQGKRTVCFCGGEA
ncbi:MAG: PEP/pyruvate-binding domain-containing protein [Lachnospiraceae bacterium]|nr:PEP/pyruvate-binding domain-containing protein [Lachnospiraceae bacterium]